MARDIKKVVLAYSGGLDTSIILKWLQTTYGCEVVTFTADLGQGEELDPARRKAENLGIKQIYIEDLREDPRVYLDNTPWGCITCAYGWQAAVGTLGQLRVIGHALRAWPTPLGVAINSADRIWDETGELIDTTIRDQLELLATQVITFACSAREPR